MSSVRNLFNTRVIIQNLFEIFQAKVSKTRKNGPSSRRPVLKTNYLKTNLLKQIKNIFSFQRAKLACFQQTAKSSRLKSFSIYIMPPIPGAPPIGIAGSFSGLSTIRHSVVRNIPAIEAAFSRATRATLAGSMTPASRRSS